MIVLRNLILILLLCLLDSCYGLHLQAFSRSGEKFYQCGGEQRVHTVAIPQGKACSGNLCGVMLLTTGNSSCSGLFPEMHIGLFPLEDELAG